MTELSRRPRNSLRQLSEDCVIEVLKIKLDHPYWGARKIQQIYKKGRPFEEAPSESSIKRILDKMGLVKKKRVKRVNPGQELLRQMIQPEGPNDVWTVDFKGWWYASGTEKCVPLTIRDQESRYIQEIRAMEKQTSESVKEVFEKVFKQYGLPKAIRTDNGTPFATYNSLLGLTRLSAWWMSLGIKPDRIKPGCPYQNGAHERMHKDLKNEVQKRYKGSLNQYQQILDLWREEFNTERPHEALGYKTPSEVYTKSERKYIESEELIYPFGFERRKVMYNGSIKIKGVEIPISSALRGYHVGLSPNTDKRMDLWFNEFLLGGVDLVTYKFYTNQNRV
jgi:putative transposase